MAVYNNRNTLQVADIDVFYFKVFVTNEKRTTYDTYVGVSQK